nr:hypothetical protein [Tanacetum cinerariifolium]
MGKPVNDVLSQNVEVDALIGYNCPLKVSVISNSEPCNNQTIDELPQTLPIFHLTFYSEAESPFTLDSTPTYVDESPNVFNPPPQPLVESEGIPEHMCDVPSHENSPPLDVSNDQIEDFSKFNEEFSSIDDDSFSIDNIDYVEASPPDYVIFSSEVMEIVIPEISSGSPTTHSDSSLYASFIFDLSINPFPPAKRSDSYEFSNEVIPFVSPPECDCFLFKVEPNSRDFTKDVVEDISPTKEPQVLNTLPTHPTLQLNIKF